MTLKTSHMGKHLQLVFTCLKKKNFLKSRLIYNIIPFIIYGIYFVITTFSVGLGITALTDILKIQISTRKHLSPAENNLMCQRRCHIFREARLKC